MTEDYPLLSVIMPTRNRPHFVRQAISYYLAQDYPNKELVIVDCSDIPSGELEDLHPDIRYTWLSTPLTIGMMRNIACSLAQGNLICHWDDDDYFGPQRLSKQAEPIIQGKATCSAMRMSLLLDANTGTMWTCSDETHRQCFKQDVHYGTLMFQASYWRDGLHFASTQIGEDRRFVHGLLAQDAQLAQIVDPGSFAYVLHGHNTTSDMRLVHPDGWQQVRLADYLPAEHWAFYRGLRSEVSV